MIIRKTRPEEGKRVNTLFAIAFEQPMENGPGEEPGVTNWGAFEGETMFSTFAVTDFTQFFDGNQVKMGGIGGVATLPSHRRKGGIRGIFQAALTDMYENGCDFSYLYPFSTAYYRKFGYENCVNRSFVTVDLGLLSPRKAETVSVLAELGSDLRGPIRELDRVWERTYNMAVCHPEKDYGWVVKADPAGKQNFLYVCFDTDRKPLAYTKFRLENQTDGRNLVCSRFCFRNRKGFDGLMNLFKGFSADHRFLKFYLPEDSAMGYLLPEWSMGAACWSTAPSGMVRAVNARRVLEKAAYCGSGRVCLELLDGQIQENNGVFDVTFENGKAVRVEKTEEKADVTLGINAFSALICGTSDWGDALQWMPDVTLHRENQALKGVFYRKKLWIGDYF